MGTNYDWVHPPCPTCERAPSNIHIGKSSMGWSFTWHKTDTLKSCQDWFAFMEKGHGKIVDEYGRDVSLDDFKALVERKRGEHKESTDRTDDDGCRFVDGEFC